MVALAQEVPIELRLFLAFLLSLMVNPAIDGLGHTEYGNFIAKSPITHSIQETCV